MDLSTNYKVSNTNKIFWGYLVTQLILKVNDLGIDPTKQMEFILGVDQLRRNFKGKMTPDYEKAEKQINEKYDQMINQLRRDSKGQKNQEDIGGLEYMRAKEIFSELMELQEATGGERILEDEMGQPEQVLGEDEITEVFDEPGE